MHKVALFKVIETELITFNEKEATGEDCMLRTLEDKKLVCKPECEAIATTLKDKIKELMCKVAFLELIEKEGAKLTEMPEEIEKLVCKKAHIL